MTTFQQKITSNAKEEENMAHSQDKKKKIETIPEEAQTLDKDLKSTVLKST